ncbi:MAG: hypothetical protein IJ540_04900 [Prevotella sp.]|nr:hypothetical protein [Prevotella sp.]
MKRLLFVCHGNICRSPMAEFVMKDLVRKAGREDDLWPILGIQAISKPPGAMCLKAANAC